ncbi:MAG: GNAT family N-acetyltransferase [Clostridiales bacterium]|nr:GNAT family N-acetyltransferase [Clostridiales bacterium]
MKTKDELLLIEPTEEYKDEIWAFRTEVLEYDAECGDKFAGCYGMSKCGSAEEWIDICRKLADPGTCNEVGAEVPSHQYLLVRQEDGRVVGIFDLREHIDHPILSVWGGYCGYTVRPSERGKGYAKIMMRLGVGKARNLGIDRLLVTCDTTNIASEKAILAGGGVLENVIEVDGCPIKRYWITV